MNTQVAAVNASSDEGQIREGRLTDTQRMLIEQRVANEKSSTGAAYLLCIFLGAFGIDRFYLGRTGSAVVMLILGITFVGLLIPGIIEEKMDALRQCLTLEALA